MLLSFGGVVLGIVDAFRERFRDHTRDEICAGLQKLGVNAQLAGRGRPKEKMGNGMLGIIDIDGGPIAWVNVGKDNDGDPYSEYGIEVPYDIPATTIKWVRRRAFPVLGRVIDADWRADGADCDSPVVAEVLRRLREDAQVTEATIATGGVEITPGFVFVSGWFRQNWSRHAWVITRHESVPTRQAWDCYQAIARHLIEAGREEPNTE